MEGSSHDYFKKSIMINELRVSLDYRIRIKIYNYNSSFVRGGSNTDLDFYV